MVDGGGGAYRLCAGLARLRRLSDRPRLGYQWK